MGRCRAPAALWPGGYGTEPEMALIPRLELRQGQALVMTPQLQQAIKLLQFSNLELVAYVEQELAENPLLEPEEDGGDGLDGAQSEVSALAISTRRRSPPERASAGPSLEQDRRRGTRLRRPCRSGARRSAGPPGR